MRLDALAQKKTTSEWYFTYYCPEQLKIRQFKSNKKNKAIIKRKDIKRAQETTPDAPTKSLTPFGLVIDAYLIDRENDVKGGRLRQATFEGYVQHIRRLRPLGAGKIDIDKDGYRFRYYKRAIGRFVWFKASSLNAAQNARDKITEVALHDDPLYAEKEATLAAPLKNLKWEFIQRILDNIERSQNTRQHHFVTFTNIISWSIKKGYLFKTQADIIAPARPARGSKTQIEIPSEESVKAFIKYSDDFWKSFWIISATTGARVSELTALKWQNVYLNEGRIYIEASTQRNGVIDAPKTRNAYRELPIGSEVIGYLSKLPRNTDLVWPCPEFGSSYWQSNQFGRTCFVKPRRLRQQNEERPMKTEEVFRIGMQPTLREHQLRWKGRIHSLRHFAASRMIDKNWNIKRIQTRLGHANATTTLDIYGHLMERQSFHQEAEELTEGLLNDNKVPQ